MNERQPLEGIQIVEMTLAVQGPAAGVFLRDMGAEIVKVEPPLGDPSRYGRNVDNPTPEGTLGPQFVAVNRGKRSVCLDATTELGREALERLLARADVFCSNYRTQALEALGLDYETLHARYPRLVYATVNGFGPGGPDADKAMLDGAAVARGGLASITGQPDGLPGLPGSIVADTTGAMQFALGIVTALLARERHGVGQRVQTSGLGGQLWLQQWELTHTAMTGTRLQRAGSHHPNIRGPYGIYQTRDGGAIMLAHTMQQDAWDAICAFGEEPELSFDPRWSTPGARLGEGRTETDSNDVRAALKRAFGRKTTSEWEAFLRTQPEAIFERVRTHHEVLDDPQNAANQYITEIEVPDFGRAQTVGNLVQLSETPGSVKGGPPLLGEANQEVLQQLGFAPEQVAAITDAAIAQREAALAELLAAATAD
ncbi:MAG: CoA transferase [Pseudomonadota bacterium]